MGEEVEGVIEQRGGEESEVMVRLGLGFRVRVRFKV